MVEENQTMGQEEFMKEVKSLQKSLRINRIFNIISSVLSLSLVVIFILAVSRLNAFATQIQPVIDKAAEIDMVQINTALENFNVMMTEMNFEEINSAFEEVDMEAIGAIVETIDTAELEETLTNINSVSEKLKVISDKLFGFWGNGSPAPEEEE
ncbi:MAG: hypothetical protein IKY53_07395 [Lachnospiraceae bacterium]|nr:hypothetical protein [Lachnospiraceae bacterium]